MEPIINIKEGLGDIKFDMTIEEVEALIGAPDEVESVEETSVLHYYGGDLTLFFDGDNPRLNCIDLSLKESTLFGEKIFDKTEKEIVQLMVNNKYFEQDADQEAWGERRVSFGEGNIDFFFEKNSLTATVYGA